MEYPDEINYRETARQIERRRPGWIVVWGCYTRQFVAFPLFRAAPGAIVAAKQPATLITSMRETENRQRNMKGAT
jgi:hypothetical protein